RKLAAQSLAPYRLGLTATFEREDGAEDILYDLIGPKIYQAGIHQMEHSVLSQYDVITMEIPLLAKDQALYASERATYLNYLRFARISFRGKNSWPQFVMRASRTPAGRKALRAYRRQKRIACNSEAKILALWQIFQENPKEKILIFTQDNELAYQIGLKYFLPVLTHHTKKAERKLLLRDFLEGNIHCLVTSKVLNEGVDVPDATVGIVVSGTGSVREHVQRLGRILRYREGKRAKLYELISSETGELSMKNRRRKHDAYS
ncbi:MAG: helicase-related protein, partial [Proteobacteria bacterium]|nr:helicase-related protein [Pseudomonadota bacterium]